MNLAEGEGRGKWKWNDKRKGEEREV